MSSARALAKRDAARAIGKVDLHNWISQSIAVGGSAHCFCAPAKKPHMHAVGLCCTDCVRRLRLIYGSDNRVVGNTLVFMDLWSIWSMARCYYLRRRFFRMEYISGERGAKMQRGSMLVAALGARRIPRLINCTLQIYSAVSFLHTRKEGSISYLCQTAKLVSLCAPRSEFRLCLKIFKYQHWCGKLAVRRHGARSEVRMGEKV